MVTEWLMCDKDKDLPKYKSHCNHVTSSKQANIFIFHTMMRRDLIHFLYIPIM